MKGLTATEASRRFSDVLDQVEHRGESFTVSRNGRVVARILPVSRGNGKELLDFFRNHRPDPEWGGELRALREWLETEQRDWNA